MDSMRSLNTSLPRTTPRQQEHAQSQSQPQQQQQSSEDILAAFRQAALSVTTLYKSAVASQGPAKAAGYQEAIEDLLTFLDKENLGLAGGEGGRIRHWASERFDGVITGRHDSDDEEEETNDDGRAESVIADPERKETSTLDEDLSSSVELPQRDTESPVAQRSSEQRITPSDNSQSAFTFVSQHQYPTNHDRDTNMDSTGENKTHSASEVNGSSQPFRFDSPAAAAPRSGRSRHSRLTAQRSSNPARIQGPGAGSKRKFPLGDFFGLDGFNFDSNHGQDRGGKRGRHT